MSRTLLALLPLGPISLLAAIAAPALADPGSKGEVIDVMSAAPVRGVAQDYLVLPEGGELGADLKLVTADHFAGMPLEFSDLGLFILRGRHSLGRHLELSAHTTLVPKQPSYTDEKVWQSVGGAVRIDVGHRSALELAADGGHLLDHTGQWTESALAFEHRKHLTEYLSFDLSGGADLITVGDGSVSAHVAELQGQAATHFRDPEGYFGAWLGVSYAVPIAHGGDDPTTAMPVDPQPRLDFHIGVALSPVPNWDVYIDAAVVDRGDFSNPATELPILDGGFDQRQLVFGVVRHFHPDRRDRHDDMPQ